MIKAEWTNKDSLDLQPTCNQLATTEGDLISRQVALNAMDTWDKFGCDPDGKLVRYDDDKHYVPYVHYDDMVHVIKCLPSAQPEQIARDIATVIENEKDMRVILKNAQPDKKEEWKMRFVLKDVRAVEIENNKVNLCDSCLHEFATCASGPNDTFFGDGKGNDNVCCCSRYEPLQSKRREVKE